MKKLILIICVLLLACQTWGVTYYVDTASTGGDGTTTATSGAQAAFATVAAAATAVTGDQHGNSLLFNRGNTWREQFVVGASGTAAGQFTIGAYGTGAAPIISGSTALSSFTSEAGGTNLLSNPEDFSQWSPSGATVTANVSTVLTPDGTTTADALVPDATANPHTIAAEFTGSVDTPYTFTCYVRAADYTKPWVLLGIFYYDAAWTPVHMSLGYFSLAASTVSDGANYTTSYSVAQPNNWRRIGLTATSPGAFTHAIATIYAAEASGDPTFEGDASKVHSYYYGAKVEQATAPTVYGTAYYKGSISTESKYVTSDGSPLHRVTAKYAMCANSFWWDDPNDRLYFRLSGLDDPAGHTIEAAQRDWGIVLYNKDYVTITDFTVKGTNTFPIYAFRDADRNAGIVLSNILIDGAADGIFINSGESSCSISSVTVTKTNSVAETYLGGINVANFDGEINDCTVHDAWTNGIMNLGVGDTVINRATIYNIGSGQFKANGGIGTINSGSTIINDSLVYNCADDGINFSGTSVGTINRTISHTNGNSDISPTNYSGDGFTAHEAAVVHLNYCVAYNNYKSGAGFSNSGVGNTIYNCTFYNNYNTANDMGTVFYGNTGILLHSAAAAGDWTVKNNITQGHSTEILITSDFVTNAVTLVSDYNLFYDSRGGTAFHYGGTDYNFADYKTASSLDGNSINADPLLTSLYKLSQNSPAVDSGVAITGLHTGSTIVGGDAAGNMRLYGSGIDMGAYERVKKLDGPPVLGGAGIFIFETPKYYTVP